MLLLLTVPQIIVFVFKKTHASVIKLTLEAVNVQEASRKAYKLS